MFNSEGRVSFGAGIACILVGLMMFLAGFVCPFWTRHQGNDIGLWLKCSPLECRSISTVSTLFGDWWSGVQFLQIMSLLVTGAAAVQGVAVFWVGSCGRDSGPFVLPLKQQRRKRLFLIITAGCGGVSGILGDVIFVGKVTSGTTPFQGLFWALFVNLAGCSLVAVASTLLALDTAVRTRSLTRRVQRAAAEKRERAERLADAVRRDPDDESGGGGGVRGTRDQVPVPVPVPPPERPDALSRNGREVFHIVVPDDAVSRNVWSQDQASTRM